ncbi:hypothetical protein, partial [Rhodococcus sp. T7]|uniref:hypothetical protein n=1 Tax=Rhodococcus sp. T7 TaxID=627444 RepID=UPI001F4245DD
MSAVKKYANTTHEGLNPEPRWASWDALIVRGYTNLPDDSGLRVIQIGDVGVGAFIEQTSAEGGQPGWLGRETYHFVRREPKPGHEMRLPGGLSELRSDLVKRHLVTVLDPDVQSRSVVERPPVATDEEWVPLMALAETAQFYLPKVLTRVAPPMRAG